MGRINRLRIVPDPHEGRDPCVWRLLDLARVHGFLAPLLAKVHPVERLYRRTLDGLPAILTDREY
jgi:hypothetical protein